MTKRIRCQIKGRSYRFDTLADAARAFLIPSPVLRARVRAGWRLSKALTTPLRGYATRPFVPHPDVVRHAERVAKASASQTRH
jgi:hypothetical protein